MIMVCECGTRLRIKHLAQIDSVRCPSCKAMVGKEAHRQAERNANIVLDIAALLDSKDEKTWTAEEDAIAQIMGRHQLGRKS